MNSGCAVLLTVSVLFSPFSVYASVTSVFHSSALIYVIFP